MVAHHPLVQVALAEEVALWLQGQAVMAVHLALLVAPEALEMVEQQAAVQAQGA